MICQQDGKRDDLLAELGSRSRGDDRCRMIGWARSRRTPEWQGECVGGTGAPRVPICPVSDSPGFDLSRFAQSAQFRVRPVPSRLDLPASICPVCAANGAQTGHIETGHIETNWSQTGRRLGKSGRGFSKLGGSCHLEPQNRPQMYRPAQFANFGARSAQFAQFAELAVSQSSANRPPIVRQSSVNRPRNSNFPAGLLECRQAISEIRVLWTVIDSHRQSSIP